MSTTSALDIYWDYLTSNLPPDETKLITEHVNESFLHLKHNDFLIYYKDWYIEAYRELVLEKILPKFWSLLPENCLPENINQILYSDFDISNSFSVAKKLFNAVNYLFIELKKCIDNVVLRGLFEYLNHKSINDFQNLLKSQLKSSFLSSIELHFKNYILLTYFAGFCLSRYQNCNQLLIRKQKRAANKKINQSLEISDEEINLAIDESRDEKTIEDDFDENVEEEIDENDESLFPIRLESDFDNRCSLCLMLFDLTNDESTVNQDQDFEQTENFSINLDDDEEDKCRCQQLLNCFQRMNKQLQALDLLEVISEDAVSSVTHSFIEKKIRKKCSGSVDVSCLKKLENWVRSTIIGWLSMVYQYNTNNIQISQNTEEMLIHYIYETYAQLRIDQIFDIIIEYPDSEPALEDLKECLLKCSGYRMRVIKSLKDSFEVRLLHPGVGTSDILAAYVQAIKALRVLDSSGVILQLVCDPVKKYLKSREDTVRCIITALTDENSELIPDFLKSDPQPIDDGINQSDDDYILENWHNWKPDPIDAAAIPANSKSIRSADIVSILVNVYESKDLFVEEYQRLLAQRFLLNNYDYNVDQERRNLELLTVRFGESDLHACEVMLADMSISKRIDNRINAGEIVNYHFKEFPIKCLILSEQFWPEKLGLPFSDEASKIRLPSIVDLAVETYTKAFEMIQVSRTLKWLKHLGTVEIELEFSASRKVSFTVSPIHAVIISQFEEKTCWTINELSQQLSLSTQVLRRKINFWQNKGILREEKTDYFMLIDDPESIGDNLNSNANNNYNYQSNANVNSNRDDFNAYDEDSFDGKNRLNTSNSGNEVNEERFRIYWSFVENMLTNLNSLSLERIHTMLQMFAFQGSKSNELSIQTLRHFLDSKVRDQKLVYSGGQYKLASNQ